MHANINQHNIPEISETDKPVDIVQELIAIHTTRIEAATRLKPLASSPVNASMINQSTKWISQLTEELSDFGDAVQSIASRENEYQQSWNAVLPNVDKVSQEDCEVIRQDMEAILKTCYQRILSKENALPASLLQMIRQQSRDIENPG